MADVCAEMRDELPLDDDLRARAAELRREWRADEEEWSLAALEHFHHGRSLVDVLRAVMHRGDVVLLGVGVGTCRGLLSHVGEDWCRLAAAGGVVELPVTTTAPVVRVVERSPRGGCGGDPVAPATWRARLLELEVARTGCAVELATGELLTGSVSVGRDHVMVGAEAGAFYVPMGAVSWLRPWCG
jgi:hypothetical protein